MTPRSTVRLPLAIMITTVGAVGAVSTGRPELALLAAPWAVLLVVGLAATRRARVTVQLGVDTDRVIVDDEVELSATVVARTPGWVTVEPLAPAAFRAPEADRGMARADVVAPRRPVTITCPLVAGEWGGHDLGRVKVRFNPPHGLVRWEGVVVEPHRIRVHPTPGDLRRLVTPWLVRRHAGTHPSSAVERGIEYADIRLFGAGDSLRDINWRASARSGELWVSDRHPERATDVVLVLDSFIESGHDVRAVVGLAIEAAVALAESHLARTDRIGLIELGGVVRWVQPGTGQHQLQRLADALLATGLYANASDRDLAMVPPRALPPRSFVVALSPLLDPRFIDTLFELRGAGHDVIVIECEAEIGVRSPTEASRVARRLWEAERTMVRDQLAARRVAVGHWRRGEPLDAVLAGIGRWRGRRRAVPVSRSLVQALGRGEIVREPGLGLAAASIGFTLAAGGRGRRLGHRAGDARVPPRTGGSGRSRAGTRAGGAPHRGAGLDPRPHRCRLRLPQPPRTPLGSIADRGLPLVPGG